MGISEVMDEQVFNEREVQELVLKARLDAARALVERGQEQEAERLYRQTLGQAEAVAGESSPLTGLVLLELIDFYDHFKRSDEAEILWYRLRQIAIAFLRTDEWGAALVERLEHD